jgi:hypothetical protein
MQYCPFNPLSQFSKIFGIPGKGLHKYRILDVASVDYFLTLIGSFILSYLTKVPLVLATIGLFILSIIVHILFGVPTSSVEYLRLACK